MQLQKCCQWLASYQVFARGYRLHKSVEYAGGLVKDDFKWFFHVIICAQSQRNGYLVWLDGYYVTDFH